MGVKPMDSYFKRYKSFWVREVNFSNLVLAIVTLHILINMGF
jgi:hypothetical protein